MAVGFPSVWKNNSKLIELHLTKKMHIFHDWRGMGKNRQPRWCLDAVHGCARDMKWVIICRQSKMVVIHWSPVELNGLSNAPWCWKIDYIYPPVIQGSYWKWPIEIITTVTDLPLKNGDFPKRCECTKPICSMLLEYLPTFAVKITQLWW